jgi:hypothetical protein
VGWKQRTHEVLVETDGQGDQKTKHGMQWTGPPAGMYHETTG